MGYFKGTITFQALLWGFLVFIAAVDCELSLASDLFPFVLLLVTVVMVLRVYAMWYQSKIILGVLLGVYIPRVILGCVFAGIYSTPGDYYSGVCQNMCQCRLA